MIIKSKKNAHIIYFLLTILALAVGAAVFMHHVKELRAEVENTFRSRNELLVKFVAMQRDRVVVMRNLLLERYNSRGAGNQFAFKFTRHPQQKIWDLQSMPAQAAGNMSGLGSLPLSGAVQREMRAALAMDAQINAALEFDNEVVWLYYQSLNNFIYIAPRKPGANFQFDPEIYRQRYWLEALPQANPEKRMILAGPYEDMAGNGRVLTFAIPVYAGGTFLGIAALDLRIGTLRDLTNIGTARGESMMISENGRLIASQSGVESMSDKRVTPPLGDKPIGWREDGNGDLWLSSPVVKDELWLAHRVQHNDLYMAAARESRWSWFMIVLFGLVVVMAIRLQAALHQVIRMTHIDPLTQALNRRGFYEQSVNTFAVGKRENLLPAIMIMDIDFFKKVNDTYGHATGDSVLKQLGNYVLKASRPYDLVCRWGGEEFVLLMLVKDGAEAAVVAERMRQEAQRTRIQPGDVPVTLSGGLVLMRPDEALDEAVRRADELLYQAKQGGRNHIVHDLQC